MCIVSVLSRQELLKATSFPGCFKSCFVMHVKQTGDDGKENKSTKEYYIVLMYHQILRTNLWNNMCKSADEYFCAGSILSMQGQYWQHYITNVPLYLLRYILS